VSRIKFRAEQPAGDDPGPLSPVRQRAAGSQACAEPTSAQPDPVPPAPRPAGGNRPQNDPGLDPDNIAGKTLASVSLFSRKAQGSKLRGSRKFLPVREKRSEPQPLTFRRERIVAELPAAVVLALTALDRFDPALVDWQRVADAVLLRVGRVLLAHADAGHSPATYRALLAHDSPAVRAVAATLRTESMTGKPYTRSDVALCLLAWFGIRGGFRRLRDNLR
jgi:hypothetical protein